MASIKRVILCPVAMLISVACASCLGPACTPGDPFVGFHAAPYDAMLELKRSAGEGNYRGSFWSDGGPFSVDLTRDGNVARGTVNYGGSVSPFRAESTSRGLILTIDGVLSPTPLQCYRSQQEFLKSANNQPSVGVLVLTTQP
jgi:hypothetical protein